MAAAHSGSARRAATRPLLHKAATPDALDIYYYMKREQPLKLLDLRLSHSSLINLTNGWDLDSENIP